MDIKCHINVFLSYARQIFHSNDNTVAPFHITKNNYFKFSFMRLRFLQTLVAIMLLSAMACKKSSNGGGSGGGTGGGGGTSQLPYTGTGTKLVVSTAQNLGASWIELGADTIFTSINLGIGLVKAIPTSYENKIISFYLPKGYQVVFAANEDGTGESACFVAVEGDIRANLPVRLRNNISYIRYIAYNNPDKKGTCSVNDATVQAFGSQWYYGWSLNKLSYPGIQYVPMTWGKGSAIDANVAALAIRKDVDHLLSFNEPDAVDQSNVPVDTAVVRYRVMMKSGLRLGSPVTTQGEAFGSGKWLTNFMAQAQTFNLRTDYICVHWYDWGNENNNAATDSLTAERVLTRFQNYIQSVRNAYPNRPIWVTEYNANRNRTSTVVHRYFMKLSSEWMNNNPAIERYSYFFPPTVPDVTATGTLTTEGNYWKGLPSTKAFTTNIIGDATIIR